MFADTYIVTLGAEWDMNGDDKSLLVAELVLNTNAPTAPAITNDYFIVKWTVKF